ncbi:ribonuclease D-like [Littorina saxatilis]|uniref:3'-5' exonuclease domain-containing protein n=1 Tax=Littorina saxatilis TaxID=31220 RepID=A0AAN9G3Z0_9CAEN
MTMPHTEVVDQVSACREAVDKLEKEEFVGVDSEGVNLSKTGPMTLLQIGTASGLVFLFDVMREPRMFKDGGLKKFLEQGSMVKVLHSARNDAEALHAQFGVTLVQNVHDVQLAHMEILRKDGAKFPSRPKLEEICEIYCPEKVALLKVEKDSMQTKWNKTEGEYWAKRPLTQEMIEYAANDVIALIPEVYLAQKKLLEDKGLTKAFQTRVKDDIQRTYDPQVRQRLEKEEKELLHSVVHEFAAIANRRTRYEDVTDENVLNALISLRVDDLQDLGLPPFFRDLKFQQIESKLNEMEEDLKLKGTEFEPSGIVCRALHFFTTLTERPDIARRAKLLEEQVNKILLDDIKNKYTTSTQAKHLSGHEKTFLSHKIRAKRANDPTIHPVVLRLSWRVKEDDLDENMERCKADPNGYPVSEGYAKLLRFYLSGDVPATLKRKATMFLSFLEQLGKVRRPQRTQRYGGLHDYDSYDDFGDY